jgi:NOL1/NOP2/sun family putative RNA methylase
VEEMASIGEVKKKLPQKFIENLYQEFTPGTADKILMGMASDRLTTLRVNTIKYNVQMLMNYFKEINIKFERVPWYKDGLIIKNAREKDLEKLEIYKMGNIYLQSLSSMVPALVLDPKPEEKILDLTAAPGSKTTQMAAMMNNKGLIVANELNKIRSQRLEYNISLLGAEIVTVLTGRGEKIDNIYNDYFDRVLIDAPCSGEGRFIINSNSTYKSWNETEVQALASLQKKLLESGSKALKAGGILVYSTCTLNIRENEEVVQAGIKNFNLEVIKTNIEINGLQQGFTGNLDKEVGKAIRILPSKDMEGFFVCKFRKKA